MRLTTLLLTALVLQDDEARRDPWAGFAPGSWVVISRKTTAAGKTTERKEKSVILPVDGDGTHRETFLEKDGEFVRSAIKVSHVPGTVAEKQMKAGASRTEELTVESKQLSCNVTEYEHEEKGVTAKLTLWRSAGAKVPYRELAKDGADLALMSDVVKVEFSLERENRKETHRIQVVSFDDKVKVGDREVACVLEVWSGEEVKGGETRGFQSRRWLSDAIPGRLVRMEGSLTGPKPQEFVQQVLDFDAKR